MSILTVTLNSCVDKTYLVPGFALDRVHRPQETVVSAGGKGINVARVFRNFGGDAVATGFLGGLNGEWLRESLQADGISPDFVSVQGESRLCLAVVDPVHGTQTEVNENGPTVSAEDVRALLDLFCRLAPQSEAVVISGSMPPGTPDTLYRDMIALAQNEYGVRVLLDTSGEPLALGAQARPFLLKPNVHELSALGIDAADLPSAAQALCARYGCVYGLVTAGARGAALASADGVWEAVPPAVKSVSAVGSGDSLTAAFLWALQNGYTADKALQLSVAAGAANALSYGAGQFPCALAFELAGRTTVN